MTASQLKLVLDTFSVSDEWRYGFVEYVAQSALSGESCRRDADQMPAGLGSNHDRVGRRGPRGVVRGKTGESGKWRIAEHAVGKGFACEGCRHKASRHWVLMDTNASSRKGRLGWHAARLPEISSPVESKGAAPREPWRAPSARYVRHTQVSISDESRSVLARIIPGDAATEACDIGPSSAQQFV